MLEVRRLAKSFSSGRHKRPGAGSPTQRAGMVHALRPVSFEVASGCVLGVLGPNGAGKTTLLRLLSTALRPSSGSASVQGLDIARQPQAVRRRLGFLSGTTGLYPRLTPRETVRYHGRLHGLDRRALRRRIQQLFERLEIEPFADRRNDALSTGMRQRVSIARTLVHDPDLIVFDEPTTGLDVAAARSILDLVDQCRLDGKTVLLSTHHMHEVQRLCDRVIVLHEGQLRFCGTVSEMAARTPSRALEDAFLCVVNPDSQQVRHAS